MDKIEQILDSNEKSGGILKEILRTPLFKDIIRDYLSNIDPKNGTSMIKTLIWEDPEVILSIMGSIPAIINWVIGALSEMGKQIAGAFPPQLLKVFIVNIGGDIDKEGFKEGLNAYAKLLKGILDASPELRVAIVDGIRGPGAKAIGSGINSASRYINKIYQENPELIGEIISGVVSNIDKKEFSDASNTLVGAVLDQRPPFVSWGLRMVGGRVRAKFKRGK
ncbi:MAG: hypothetical protein U9P49_07060 [Thermodesulfobacteriota bacterium]|nr:hypothetical protein [Thermodesulfobacteriota bacterium]